MTVAAAGAAVAYAPWASAAYPDRPIRLLVGYAPGGSTDIVARTLLEPLRAALGQPVLVENVPGASGGIATQRTIAAAADGYTLQVGNVTEIVLNPLINPALPYDAQKGLAPIAYIGSVPSVLIGKSALPAGNLQQLTAHLKAYGSINAGTPGAGTPQHLALELFKAKTGIRAAVAHYKGGAPLLADVMGGHLDVAVIALTSVLAHMKAPNFRMFGVTTTTRSPLAPELPSIGELPEFKGFDLATWWGFYALARTPEAVLVLLQDAMVAVLKDAKVRAQLEQQGMTVTPEDRHAFEARMRREARELRAIVTASDIKPGN